MRKVFSTPRASITTGESAARAIEPGSVRASDPRPPAPQPLLLVAEHVGEARVERPPPRRAGAGGEDREEPAPDQPADEAALGPERLRSAGPHPQRANREPREGEERVVGGDEALERAPLARCHHVAAALEQHARLDGAR